MGLFQKTTEGKRKNLRVFFFLQFMLLMLVAVPVKANAYAEEDRYYSMQNKVSTTEDGYVKLSINKSTKNVTVNTYQKNCQKIVVRYQKNAEGNYTTLATKNNVNSTSYSFTTSLANLSDGNYMIYVKFYLNGESTSFEEKFHVVVENGTPFFVKDFAYDLAEKQLNVLEKLCANSMLNDTTYLGSSYSEMKAKADSIVAGCTTNYEKCDALYQWVMEHVTYEGDTENEAVDVFKTGKGVCFGYANLLTAMLRLEGIPAATITGGVYNKADYFKTEPSDYYSGDDMGPHAWTACYFDGKWRYFDATWDDDEITPKREWFDLTMERMAQNRTNLKLYHTFIIGDYLYSYDEGQLAVSSYMGSDTTIALPSEFLGEKINSTGWLGFYQKHFTDKNNTNIQKVVIPESTEFYNLGNDAFRYYSKLQAIVVPDTIKTIDEGALLGCGSQLTVYCTSGSAMEKYAKENNLKYVLYQGNCDVLYSSVTQGNSSYDAWASDGTLSGTEGQNKKVTKLKITTPIYDGVSIRAYINDKWTDWKSNGEISGNGSDIQAIQVKVSGDLASKYDVYYRTHNRYFGWLGWTKNGATAGTRNEGSAIEGFQIKLVKKGTTVNGITNDTNDSYKEKYKVVFKNYNGTVLSTQYIEYGKSATAPSNPTRTNYVFTGWSGPYTNIKADTEITAQYRRDIKVTSVDINGGADVVAGQKAYIKINTNHTGDLAYTVDIRSIAGNMQIANKVSNNVIEWTPSESYAGAYCTIEISVTDSTTIGNTALYTTGCSVKKKTENITTIYYKGYENPNIHYKVGNGSWTNVPGIKMEANSDVDGYNYAISINLGTATSLTACFNDGNGNWDSANGSNYTFGTGYYTYSNQKITKINKPEKGLKITKLTASPENSIVEGQQVIFKTETEDAQGTLKYKYVATSSNGTTQTLRDYSTYNDLSWLPGSTGKYKITVYVTDGVTTQEKTIDYEVTEFKSVNISKLESSLGTEYALGKTTNISMEAKDGYAPYTYSIKVNGTEILSNTNAASASWTASQVGSYSVVATATDARGTKTEKSMTINVVESNSTTIYYKGYENPNIHYKVGNGAWTNAPGVKMESNSDVDGYNYSITIDLGDATSITACFNDGNGNWDSNNGQNYTFGTGYYTYNNQKITKIEKPSSELRISSITSSAGDTMKMGSSSNITINAGGGEGPYTYNMYYSLYGSGKSYYILNGSQTNTAVFTPDYSRNITLYVEVTDAAGTKVTAQKVISVKEVSQNQVTIYYKGYNNPNIHYKVGNGNWTNVPGVKMESSSKVSGYPYAITIDLGEETSLTACFNDGNGNWDSANGNNYNFSVGEFTYSNGTITKIN